MKTKLIFLMVFLAMIAPAFAVSNTACLDANTLEANTTISGSSNVIITEDKNCPTGCSTTLQDCRSSNPMQIVWFSAIIIGMILMLWFFDSIGWAGYALDFLLIIITITFATFDIFSYAWMTTMFLVMIFVIFTAMLIRFAAAERGKVKDDEYGE